MAKELIYTSVAKGLRPGSRGFCTVATSDGIATNLASRLESLSAYRHVFTPGGPEAKDNPVNLAHVVLTVAGKTYHVLSRVADYGLDYTSRSNKLAHHLALEENELVGAGPAWMLAQPGLMEREWQGESRHLPSRSLPQGQASATPCQAWERMTGDAGWGGVLSEAAVEKKNAFVIFRPGMNLLPLIEESVRLLPEDKRWGATFSTYFQNFPAGVECRWRCVVEGSDEARRAIKDPRATAINLCERGGAVPESPWVEAARTGKAPRIESTTGFNWSGAKERREAVAEREAVEQAEREGEAAEMEPRQDGDEVLAGRTDSSVNDDLRIAEEDDQQPAAVVDGPQDGQDETYGLEPAGERTSGRPEVDPDALVDGRDSDPFAHSPDDQSQTRARWARGKLKKKGEREENEKEQKRGVLQKILVAAVCLIIVASIAITVVPEAKPIRDFFSGKWSSQEEKTEGGQGENGGQGGGQGGEQGGEQGGGQGGGQAVDDSQGNSPRVVSNPFVQLVDARPDIQAPSEESQPTMIATGIKECPLKLDLLGLALGSLSDRGGLKIMRESSSSWELQVLSGGRLLPIGRFKYKQAKGTLSFSWTEEIKQDTAPVGLNSPLKANTGSLTEVKYLQQSILVLAAGKHRREIYLSQQQGAPVVKLDPDKLLLAKEYKLEVEWDTIEGESIRAVFVMPLELAKDWSRAKFREFSNGQEYTYQYRNDKPDNVIEVKVTVTAQSASEVTVETTLTLPEPYPGSEEPAEKGLNETLSKEVPYAALDLPAAQAFEDELSNLGARIAEVKKALGEATIVATATGEKKYKDEEKRLRAKQNRLIALQNSPSPYLLARKLLLSDSFKQNVCFAEKPRVVIERKYLGPGGQVRWIRR